MTLPRLLLFAVLISPAAALIHPPFRSRPQVQATLVSADTAGIFFRRGPDTLFVANRTWASRDSAPRLPDCVYSGRSQRMLARDSMRLTITDASRTVWWDVVLRPNDAIKPQVTLALPHTVMHLLDVSAQASPCGVNAGQVYFHWSIER